MKIKFEAKFEKDLRKIKDQKVLSELKQIIIRCKTIENRSEITHLKKLQGYDTFYRIRLGNYRIGIELSGDTIIFTRFLHRKDIYKFFP
jgi:mRNA interferase RelE/StbE